MIEDVVLLINDVGFPIATAGALLYFVQHLLNRIINNMEAKIDVLDEKLGAIIDTTEGRLSSKLDSQYGILVSLIDRIRQIDQTMLRNDIMLKTILKVPELIDTYDITKAQKDDQRKD